MSEQDLNKTVSDALAWEYAQQQREEFRQLANERSALTYQVLGIDGGALAVTFSEKATMSGETLYLGLGILLVLLGIFSFMMHRQLEELMEIHIQRARNARRQLNLNKFDEGIKDSIDKARPGLWHASVYVMTGSVGLLTLIFCLIT